MSAQKKKSRSIHQIILLNIIVPLLFSTPAGAGWDEGMAASQKGDHKKAYEELLPIAEQGHVSAQTTIGVMYYNGQGVPVDYEAALVWLSLAAGKGHDVAQFNLAVMFDSGTGTDQDFNEAANWYRRAAQQGHVRAQYNLAAMYENGDGVKQDAVRALAWFNIAAAQGDDEAAGNVSRLEQAMTSKQVTAASKLAAECVDNGYKGC